MKRIAIFIIFVLPVIVVCSGNKPDNNLSSGKSILDTTKSVLCERVLVPEGYNRIAGDKGSFAYYLQHLPLKAHGSEVLLFDGTPKGNQGVHVAVVDLDVGDRDLQQCADAVMRLRAEYLFHQKRFDEISFNFVSDSKPRYLKDYCSDKTNYTCYRKYMNYVFGYANTRSLFGQLIQRPEFEGIAVGDVLIQTGNPYGHAVIVVDMAESPNSGERLFLLAQSYMPAQDIHILKNLNDKEISPWYRIPSSEVILTPEWTFNKRDLRSF